MKDQTQAEQLETICKLASSWFIRQDNKFYSVDRPTTKLAKADVEMIILNRLTEELPALALTQELVRGMFKRIIVDRHTDRTQTIPVWNGASFCDPSNVGRTNWQRGSVSLNTWTRPDYRNRRVNSADYGPVVALVEAMFTTQEEGRLFLDWVAWNLQNESDKPAWAPFLYSRSKGTGKSTLCNLVATLFGLENTAVQNNVDQLTGRFNSTVLLSKLVICEETYLSPGSSQGNTLKMNITEEQMLVERKGLEAERVRQCCCFMFTSNHFPTWMEPGERRYQVFDVDHDGCSGGSEAEQFGKLIASVKQFYATPENLGSLYNALMQRTPSEHFDAKALNKQAFRTETMQRLEEASEHTIVEQLREALDRKGMVVIPQATIAELVRKDLGGSTNQTRYLMGDLGWRKRSLKWGSVDHARVVWHRPEINLDSGKIYGDEFDGEPMGDYLERFPGFEPVEMI